MHHHAQSIRPPCRGRTDARPHGADAPLWEDVWVCLGAGAWALPGKSEQAELRCDHFLSMCALGLARGQKIRGSRWPCAHAATPGPAHVQQKHSRFSQMAAGSPCRVGTTWGAVAAASRAEARALRGRLESRTPANFKMSFQLNKKSNNCLLRARSGTYFCPLFCSAPSSAFF